MSAQPELAAAFTTRISSIAPRLTRQARHLAACNPIHTADDMQQNMLLKLWEQASKNPQYLSQPDVHLFAFATWKGRSLATSGRTYSKYIEAESFVADEEGDEISAFEFISTDDPESRDPAEIFAENETFQQALALLNPTERKIVEMLYQGYSQVEIAAELGVHKSYITQLKSRIAQAFAMCI